MTENTAPAGTTVHETFEDVVRDAVHRAVAQTYDTDTQTGYTTAAFDIALYRVYAVWTDFGYTLSVVVAGNGDVFANIEGVDEDLPDVPENLDGAAADLCEQLRIRTARADRNAEREIRYGSVCDGGSTHCRAAAVWAFRLGERDAWTYACGRHLSWAMTYACDGEHASFDVRRITTEER